MQQLSGGSMEPGSDLFNRVAELEWAEEQLCRVKPRSIQVIVGPRSSGKTAVLQAFQASNPKVVYVDCREYDISSPSKFIAAVLDRALRCAPGSLQDLLVQRLVRFGPNAEQLASKIQAAATIADVPKFQLSITDLGGLFKSLVMSPEREGAADALYREIRCALVAVLHGLVAGSRTPLVPQAQKLRSWAPAGRLWTTGSRRPRKTLGR
jgi:hypothetical protein